MAVDIKMPPYLPHDVSNEAIGFITAYGYDERNTKVILDTAHTVISNNTNAKFVVASDIMSVVDNIKDCLHAHGIKDNDIAFVFPDDFKPMSPYEYNQDSVNRLDVHNPANSPHSQPSKIEYAQNGYRLYATGRAQRHQKDRTYHGRKSNVANTLEWYKNIIGQYRLNTVVVFSDNPKSTEINELLKSALEYGFKVVTITSDGDFTDLNNPMNKLNHKRYYGGLYRNEHLKED